MGGRAIACLNARDRNVLGFRRDLLTAAAYGVREFLFVYGDRPESGSRSDDLTVRSMLAEARAFDAGLRLGATTRLAPLPAWKRDADFLCVQVGFSVDELLAWRDTLVFDGPVYAGVMVVPSAATARKISGEIAQLRVPDALIAALEADRNAGVGFACDMIDGIRASGAFDGVHLVATSRYRDITVRLERNVIADRADAPQ
jgi:5,10-methylenetetrahydrofolate reductase